MERKRGWENGFAREQSLRTGGGQLWTVHKEWRGISAIDDQPIDVTFRAASRLTCVTLERSHTFGVPKEFPLATFPANVDVLAGHNVIANANGFWAIVCKHADTTGGR